MGTGFGLNPISFQDIKAWCDLRKVDLQSWQLDAILAMDLKRRVVATADKTAADAPPTNTSGMFPEVTVKRFRPDGTRLN